MRKIVSDAVAILDQTEEAKAIFSAETAAFHFNGLVMLNTGVKKIHS